MSSDVHYEVFFKKCRKSSWALFEARDDRDAAIKLAHKLISKNKSGSVRVTKEHFRKDHHTFRSVPIFEGGAEKLGTIEEKTAEASIPCLSPDDLSKPHARDTIRRVLAGWLERTNVLPMELLHRPDLVEKLEASEAELQHAIQKVAIASASDSDASAHGYVTQLNDLVQSSLSRIYKDRRTGKLPTYPEGEAFADVITAHHVKGTSAYHLRAIIADLLKNEKTYSKKLDVLLELSDSLPAEEAPRNYALKEIDSYISEVISFDAGREATLGICKDLGESVERMVCIFDGDHGADVLNLAPSTAKKIARKINRNEFDNTRLLIANRILKEMQCPKRLRPSSVKEEVRLSRDLAQKLVMSAGPLLPLEELNKAFTSRSTRLLRSETIDELLKYCTDPNQEISALLSLEENLVGEANKQKLAGYIRGALSTHQTESWFLKGPGQPLEHLAALTTFQGQVLRGKYSDVEKSALSADFDALGMKVINETRILNMVEAGDRPALDKANAMLRLATAGALPLGKCSSDAQARALRHLSSNDAMQAALNPDSKAKLRAIQIMLDRLTERHKAA